jgi:hypothetical protein
MLFKEIIAVQNEKAKIQNSEVLINRAGGTYIYLYASKV